MQVGILNPESESSAELGVAHSFAKNGNHPAYKSLLLLVIIIEVYKARLHFWTRMRNCTTITLTGLFSPYVRGI